MQDLRFPVGPFVPPGALAPEDRVRLIDGIAGLPDRLASVVEPLSEEQLDLRYRPDGWTVRQVIHHLPESHLNGYLRCKLTLTEEHPTIRPYNQDAWARLSDIEATPIDVSLRLLEAVHQRWVHLWRCLSGPDFARTLDHPEEGQLTLDLLLALYEWHGRHHLSHIRLATEA